MQWRSSWTSVRGAMLGTLIFLTFGRAAATYGSEGSDAGLETAKRALREVGASEAVVRQFEREDMDIAALVESSGQVLLRSAPPCGNVILFRPLSDSTDPHRTRPLNQARSGNPLGSRLGSASS